MANSTAPYTAADATAQVDAQKKQEELQRKAAALLEAKKNTPTGEALMSEKDAKDFSPELGPKINRLTGLPFGYRAGDELPKNTANVTAKRAAESVARQEAAPSEAAAAAQAIMNLGARFDSPVSAKPAPATASPTKAPDYAAQYTAARTAYNKPLTEGGGPGEEAAVKNAKLEMGRINQAAQQGQNEYFRRIDGNAGRLLQTTNPKAFEEQRKKVELETGGTTYSHLQDWNLPAKKKVDTSEFYTTPTPSVFERLLGRANLKAPNQFRSVLRK